MDLRTGKTTGPVDLTTLDASLKGFQLYGFDAWDESGRFYFSAFGARHGPRNARLVAVDPAQLPFQRPAPAGPPLPDRRAASPLRTVHGTTRGDRFRRRT